MNNLILISIGSTVGLGVFFACVLAAANKTLKVEEDPRIAAVEEMLPGLNCGACGFAGCQAYAVSLVKGEASVNACSVGGAEVAGKLAELLGMTKEAVSQRIAVLHCNADDKERTKSAVYKGIKTCRAADLIKGVINCSFGCLGFGDCADICPFGAIKMVEGLPLVDCTKCTACGKCVQICPRGLFSIENVIDLKAYVACNSKDAGSKVRKICSKGCIACNVCEKLSEGVFKVEGNLAGVDAVLAKSKQIDWEKVINKCPTKVILKA